jgi:hypothetical protein
VKKISYQPAAKIIEKCGHPDEETGADKYVFVYNLEAGAKVTISDPYLRHIEKISYQPAAALKIRAVSFVMVFFVSQLRRV